MITLFRRIRQKLLANGSLTKYLLYAIGEILLVVIGILIALQVNNWNEGRIQREQETYYLEKLTKEMEDIRGEAAYMLRFANLQKKHARMVLDALQSEDLQDTLVSAELLIAIQHCGWAPHPNFATTVWDELNSSAKLSLIRNRKITDETGKIFASIERILSREDEFKDYNLQYRELAYEALSPEIRFEIIQILRPDEILTNYENATDAGPVVMKLRDMPSLKRLLADIIITRDITILFMNELTSDVDEIMPLLGEY